MSKLDIDVDNPFIKPCRRCTFECDGIYTYDALDGVCGECVNRRYTLTQLGRYVLEFINLIEATRAEEREECEPY